ncbi:hypothetical protein PAXINDRAFT_101175 [Paxillus involutus ATCC 200175]|uniref:Uncharacterized protein n=1 Tax=Paxillus involutus ATCC 200175 TaxID=664439 RepID=A0A0C9TY98_PAXIN|nr:hypothetical protein PAXINDRAFT_101175 [Paxillus involutus ATCC 200175]
MTKSKQPLDASPSSGSKEKKARIFYEHGRDALGLALSIAEIQEDKASRKVGKHHQPQAGKSRSKRKETGDKKKRLDETKAIIAKQRAQSKKGKARSRKESKNQLRRPDDSTVNVQGSVTDAAPRKRVSFA